MNVCFIRVETIDAVNVTHDGILVTTSLGEIVVGKYFAEVAEITVSTVEIIEVDTDHSIKPKNDLLEHDNSTINVTLYVIAIIVYDSGVKVTTMAMKSGLIVCTTLKYCLLLTTTSRMIDEIARC